MSDVQKDLEDVSAGIGIFFKSDTQEFCLEFDIKVGKVHFDLAPVQLGLMYNTNFCSKGSDPIGHRN